MAGSIYAWSTTAASNASSDGDINWNEGQAPSTVNNSARQVMGRVAEWVKDQGALTAGGTANAITVTANSAFTSYATGQVLAFKAAADNNGATTLSVNAIGAKSIRKFTPAGESALEAGDIKVKGIFLVHYDAAANSAAGGWVLINPLTVAGDSLALTSTDAGSAIGPGLALYRNSASPAPADLLGTLSLDGKDAAGNRETYARIAGQIADPTSGSEDGNLLLQTATAGAITTTLLLAEQARFSVPVTPHANDGAPLGAGAFSWSDLFLAPGGVINWGNGDVVFTHSSNALTLGGAQPSVTFNIGNFSMTGADAGREMGRQTMSSSAAIVTSAGHQRFYNPNGQVGSIGTSGTATSYATSSDGRRKKNLRDFDSGGFLDALEIWLFDWNTGGTGYGVIAQQAREVFPDAITEGDDGYLQADYSKFVPLLIREVKALRARVAALEAA